jgi:hypothetical protein
MALAIAAGGRAAAEAPAEVVQAVTSLGAPGYLWGRLAVEEESPEGAWTPLAGVEVRLYPYAAGLAADLEDIRRHARDSGPGYDAAVGRLQARLEAYTAHVDDARSGAGGWGHAELVRRRVTDAAGLFVFDVVPSGDWLLVAVRVTEYTATAPAKADPRRGTRAGPDTFLNKPRPAAKNAEVWVARVRVETGERARLLLTDRGRFMAGPVRESTAK